MQNLYSIFNAEFVRYDIAAKKPRTVLDHHGYLILAEHSKDYVWPDRPSAYNTKIREEIHFFVSDEDEENPDAVQVIEYDHRNTPMKPLCFLKLFPLISGSKGELIQHWDLAKKSADHIADLGIPFNEYNANCQSSNRTVCEMSGISFEVEGMRHQISGGEHSLMKKMTELAKARVNHPPSSTPQ